MFIMNKRKQKPLIIQADDGTSNQVVTYKGTMAPPMVDINVTDELLPYQKPPVEEPAADISEFIRKVSWFFCFFSYLSTFIKAFIENFFEVENLI